VKRDPNRKFWNPDIETMPREELKKLQMKRLKKQIKYNYENSIFYREQFDRARIKPKDIQTFSDFTHLPTMDKDVHRQCQEISVERFGHPYGMLACAPIDKIVRINSTSGTTGIPTLYTLTQHDIAINREFHARKLWLRGIRPGDIILHAVGMSMFVSGIPVVDGIQEYGACIVPVGLEAGISRILQYWELCKPGYMETTPSFAEYLIQKCPEILGKAATEIGMKGMVVGAEPGGEMPEVRKRIIEGLNLNWLANNRGASDPFHGTSCDSSSIELTRGMHLVSEDYCILELLDPETKQSLDLEDGTTGEMCYTYLGWEGTPLQRYCLGDMLEVFTSPCECGATSLRFKIFGRSDDMLMIKGVKLFPGALKNFMAGFRPRVTGEFRILLDAPGPRVNPPLKVQVEFGEDLTREDLPDLEKEMRQRAHEILRITPEIEFVPANTFEHATYKSDYIVKRYMQKKTQ